jgi:hypothetical protein
MGRSIRPAGPAGKNGRRRLRKGASGNQYGEIQRENFYCQMRGYRINLEKI